MDIDSDIEGLMRHELKAEIRRLRTAIRKHRDQKLDDRCWMDDFELYESLPEGIDPSYVDLRLLPHEVMMKNCDHFVRCRSTELNPEEAIRKYKEHSNERICSGN